MISEDFYTCRLGLGSELRMDEFRFRTKSLGADLY